eukprot:1144962-Pelagomonas_calceolata.AAC.8
MVSCSKQGKGRGNGEKLVCAKSGCAAACVHPGTRCLEIKSALCWQSRTTWPFSGTAQPTVSHLSGARDLSLECPSQSFREALSASHSHPTYSKVRPPSQLLPEQRHIHPVEVKHCEDTRPKNQLQASKQQHRDLYHHLSRASAQVTLHTILIGVGGVIYTPHTLEPLKELGLDTRTATKL